MRTARRAGVPSRRSASRGLAVAAVAAAALVAGCGGDQSTLNDHSPQSRDIATLWWWMLAVAGVVFGGAVVMLALGYARRRRRGLPVVGENEKTTEGLVVIFGIAVPVIVLVTLFIVANFGVMSVTRAPAEASTRLTIRVIGHQWFWEVRYPGTKAVTDNEIHIPAGTRVTVIATTADVIHSIWVPELNRKVDMIPGHRNRLLLYADKPGEYRGQCAEFCGAQHAHMALKVFADPPQKFQAWLRAQGAPRRAPAGGLATRGEQVFLGNACASCHAIRGTSADGQIGPDLTHVGSRTSLASDTIPNTPAQMREWISDPQHVKPAAKMPALNLSGRDFDALVAYLKGLR